MRGVILDTETTGLLPERGHRILELAAVEIRDAFPPAGQAIEPTGRVFYARLDPERDSEPGALEVHGITREMTLGQPRFADIADAFLAFVRGSLVIIHNAPFDVGFLDAGLARLGPDSGRLHDHAMVLCTRSMAYERLPGIRHSLDALCLHYGIDTRARTFHGALTDALLLLEVYRRLIAEPEDKTEARA